MLGIYIHEMLCDRIYNALVEEKFEVGEKLPSVRDLMKRYGVASATIQRAFKKLAEEKKIVKIPGKGCYWESFDNHLKENLKSSKQDCLELFESDWESGFFKLGKPLPGLKELSLRYNCSRVSLQKMLSEMEIKKRLVKKGRYYFIYSERFSKENRPLGQILFITRCNSMGEFKAESERELEFLRNIYHQALKLNYKLTLLGFEDSTGFLFDRGGKKVKPADYPLAIGAIISTLLIQNPLSVLKLFTRVSYPVSVWWEHPADVLPMDFLKKEKWNFFNSTFGKRPGIELGKFLKKQGYSEVVYFSPYHKSSWSKDRLEGLRESGFDVLEFTDGENASPFDFKQAALLEGPEYAVSFLARNYTKQILLSLSVNAPCDVPWVCVNDEVASIFKEVAETGSLKIAKYLISFDNSAESYLLRLDSFDFNTETLVEQMYLALENTLIQKSKKKLVEIAGKVIEK